MNSHVREIYLDQEVNKDERDGISFVIKKHKQMLDRIDIEFTNEKPTGDS